MLHGYWPLTFQVIYICFLIFLVLSKRFLQLCFFLFFFLISCPCCSIVKFFRFFYQKGSQEETQAMWGQFLIKGAQFCRWPTNRLTGLVPAWPDIPLPPHLLPRRELLGVPIYLLRVPPEDSTAQQVGWLQEPPSATESVTEDQGRANGSAPLPHGLPPSLWDHSIRAGLLWHQPEAPAATSHCLPALTSLWLSQWLAPHW